MVTSREGYICPHCGKHFRGWYLCQPWSRKKGGQFVGADGFARANFDRHREACRKRKEKKPEEADA